MSEIADYERHKCQVAALFNSIVQYRYTQQNPRQEDKSLMYAREKVRLPAYNTPEDSLTASSGEQVRTPSEKVYSFL